VRSLAPFMTQEMKGYVTNYSNRIPTKERARAVTPSARKIASGRTKREKPKKLCLTARQRETSSFNKLHFLN